MYKKEIRILGIDDSPFNKFKKGNSLIIGTIFRGGTLLDGILTTKVAIDGSDSTKKLIKMINSSKFKPQLRCIMLNGIAVAGFNIIDIEELNKKTKIPIIVVIRKYPDFKTIESTLKKIKQHSKYQLIEKAGPVEKIGRIYIQRKGITLEKAKELLNLTCTRSLIPEPIRAAHLIAGGVITGESKGKA
ncbi:MAG: DUF99 family protein [Nanoarchaeota archaeon]|nr:DUF99 family protein [Nanoarchaeota archaeon]MBU1005626.1 DUF99 family protein [Nanoarchaeota archaeon]MBU1946354.1 DUF99 family protein [Nanoarchaeota archaeon]